MSDEIDRLWALKGLDEQLVAARAALARYPEQKRALEARAADEKKKLEGLQGRIAEAQKRRRELERDAETAGEQERKFASQLPMVKKNDEYQALLQEISAAKTRRSEIETQVLLQMDTEDGLGRERPVAEKALKSAEAELNTRRAEIEAEERAAQQKVDALQAQRAEQMAPLPAAMRSRYERAHQSLNGLAVVAILKNACGGCYRAQPPQVVAEARRRDRLIICEGCGRLLVWPPEGA
ncbi:MAG TPA: C4-type zinc ribbon domain-containing protein [Candidatus Sulfotelmatobacter sp.]|nr:C4-type zinc ribbon domain-containing protein [Candidatus Sulfotelmatobacter sp.]